MFFFTLTMNRKFIKIRRYFIKLQQPPTPIFILYYYFIRKMQTKHTQKQYIINIIILLISQSQIQKTD